MRERALQRMLSGTKLFRVRILFSGERYERKQKAALVFYYPRSLTLKALLWDALVRITYRNTAEIVTRTKNNNKKVSKGSKKEQVGQHVGLTT